MFGFVCVVIVTAAPDPSALAAKLADPSARRRDEAARELLEIGPSAAPALEGAASSSDPEVRTRARALLALLRDGAKSEIRLRQAESCVRDALRAEDGLDPGSDHDARIAALLPESSRSLADAARRMANRGFVPRPLASALARHATSESLLALAEFVRDERVFPSGGLAAAREIDRAFAATPERADGVRDDAREALAALDLATRSDHAPTRRMAVALYGALVNASHDERLVELAGDTDAGVRAETARVMGLYAPARFARALRGLACDTAAHVREAAFSALLRVPGVPHPEPAVSAADDASPAVRAAAARLLGRDATPDSLPVLETLATDPSVRVRAAARRSLAALR